MMQPRKQLDVSETNMALVGSELEKKIKLAAAKTCSSWEGAGSSPGVEVWRIEKFVAVRWPKEQFGSFFDGDSYIVLHTQKVPDQTKLKWDVYFWLGRYTSIDEAGTAAYKTVELDDLLGGEPVQHREVQGNETSAFLNMFPNQTLTIMNGGVDSGFRQVDATTSVVRPTLFHVTGPTMKSVRVTECPVVSASSLSEADCYVMLVNGGKLIYVFQGSNASPGEMSRASMFATSFQEREKSSKVVVVRTSEAPDAFWEALGGKGPVPLVPTQVEAPPAANVGGAATVQKPCEGGTIRLYHVSDASGSLVFKLVATDDAIKSFKLEGDDCFVLYDPKVGAFVWVGSKSNDRERREALVRGQALLNIEGNPNGALSRCSQFREPKDFLVYFDTANTTTVN